MSEVIDEAVLQHVRDSERYQAVMGSLLGMAEDGDVEAVATLSVINSIIPPKEPAGYGKPQEVKRPKTPEVQKKHIKQDGKK